MLLVSIWWASPARNPRAISMFTKPGSTPVVTAKWPTMASQRARAARADPRLLLPEVRSILVVAANYPSQEMTSASLKRGAPRVAAYARGDDYHDTLTARLQGVVRRLEAHVGGTFPYRIYVDTGPLLERELAQRAGLGWIGKNTCLINSQIGSYLPAGRSAAGAGPPT